ncbi:MAG: ABC transporter ATP-binding protein [Ancalomicrobiaceae bacterium]|nr:ABC transporter ATP-binding protein [Ancalomicrobiaceae bacterium]
MTAPPLLDMRGITKVFGEAKANDGIDLVVRPGDVLGLLGENGAGKTTLMNVLFGTYHADAGEIFIAGKPVRIRNSADALSHGIGMVHQHFHLAPRLSVLENLLIGQKGRRLVLDRGRALERLDDIRRDFGLWLEPHRMVSSLSVGEQQRLEIVKALYRGARLLILDEPTAVLTPAEAEGLFAAMRAMSEQGFGIVFISHKLAEVRAVATRCVVLRHGQVAGSIERPGEATNAEIARMMCGRDITPPERRAVALHGPVLELSRVSTRPRGGAGLDDVSLTVRGGEILGIAGVSGNGQRALADLVSGMLAATGGEIRLAGEPLRRAAPAEAQRLGLGRIPEDRMKTGLVTGMSVADNMILSRLADAPFSRRGWISPKAIRAFASERIEAFDIRCPGPEARAGMLSGGNLQKILLARELAHDPIALVAAQPTRGLDIGATQFVHDRFLEMRDRGRGILLISEDLEELMALSDRIAVMYGGRIVGEMPTTEATIERVGLLMAGAETGRGRA